MTPKPIDLKSGSYKGPGVYKHYKDNLYEVYGLAINEEDKATVLVNDAWDHARVIYRPISTGSMLENLDGVGFWSRSLIDFNEFVTYTGILQPRFELVSDEGIRMTSSGGAVNLRDLPIGSILRAGAKVQVDEARSHMQLTPVGEYALRDVVNALLQATDETIDAMLQHLGE